MFYQVSQDGRTVKAVREVSINRNFITVLGRCCRTVGQHRDVSHRGVPLDQTGESGSSSVSSEFEKNASWPLGLMLLCHRGMRIPSKVFQSLVQEKFDGGVEAGDVAQWNRVKIGSKSIICEFIYGGKNSSFRRLLDRKTKWVKSGLKVY